MSRLPRTISLLLLVVFVCISSTRAVAPQEDAFSFLSAKDTIIVDESGNQVVLKGCNLGNWFLLEMWMLAVDHGQFEDQYSFEKNLADRFGESEKNRLMELYRENWITPRDFKIIKSFGFIVVRLPFNYRLLQDEDKPFELKKDAFKWLDRAIEMAEAEGIYVILDMHGVPGSQSIDHPTGRTGQNKVWDENLSFGKQTTWLWGKIAQRYRGRKSVAGYDVINEPYGDFSADVRPDLFRVFSNIYDAIREHDNRHIIWAPAPIWGGHGFYGKPAEHGWTNVGFTEHHYPGLFGSETSKSTHGKFFARTIPAKQAEIEEANVPLFIGEWNPVFEHLGGGDLMRMYFDEYGKRGWAATIWSYKILHNEGGVIKDNWYMVSNAETLDKPNFETASIDQIEAYFKWLGTMKYIIDEPMRKALTRPDPVVIDLPKPPPVLTKPPHTDEWKGWTATDIDNAKPGGMHVISDNQVTIYGGGGDIWNQADQFRFVSKKVAGDFTLTATLNSLEETNIYAKAGLMIRSDLSPNAAHVLLHAFPSGETAFGWRAKPSDAMQETRGPELTFPITLRLTRKGNTVTGEYKLDNNWHPLGQPLTLPALSNTAQVGLATLSHDNAVLTTAKFNNINLTHRHQR